MFWTAAKSDIDDPLMHEFVMDVATKLAAVRCHARLSMHSHFENLVLHGVKDVSKAVYSCYLPSVRHKGVVADSMYMKSAVAILNLQDDKNKVFTLGLAGVDTNDKCSLVSVVKLLGDTLNEPSAFMVLADPYYECDQAGNIFSTDGVSQEEVGIANQLGIKCYNLHIEKHRDMLLSLIKNME